MEPQARERLLLRVDEVVELLGVSRSLVYELLASGRLESVTIGRSRRVPAAAVDDFVERLRVEGRHVDA